MSATVSTRWSSRSMRMVERVDLRGGRGHAALRHRYFSLHLMICIVVGNSRQTRASALSHFPLPRGAAGFSSSVAAGVAAAVVTGGGSCRVCADTGTIDWASIIAMTAIPAARDFMVDVLRK